MLLNYWDLAIAHDRKRKIGVSSSYERELNVSINGWLNVNNEPVICATITIERGEVFLYETIDTSDQPHASESWTEISYDLISSCES